jgi:glycosyltransferase involved in cell wall biosynthesis
MTAAVMWIASPGPPQSAVLRLLVLSPLLPHPAASHGGAVYLGSLLQGLVRRARVALVSFLKPSERRWGSAPPAGLERWDSVDLPQRHDLPVGRMLAHKLRMAWRWSHGRPLLAAKHWDPRMTALIERVVAEHAPDAVLVEFAVMAQYLPFVSGRPTVLTDHESGDALPGQVGPLGFGRRRDRRLWLRYVKRYYPRATLLQALNQTDAERLATLTSRPVEVRPPIVPVPAVPCDPAQAPPRALFLGDFSHHPNPEAAARIATAIWPLVRQLEPAAELVLAGPRMDAATQALAARPGVRVLGYVPELDPLLRDARLLLAPLFSGGGSRIKVLTALAHGVPVVSNALGLRGIEAPADAVRRAETPAALAEAAAGFLRTPAAAGAAGACGRAWAAAEMDPARLADRQLARIEALLADPRRR